MPARSFRRQNVGPALTVSEFLELAADPESYRKRLVEFGERQSAAEEAEKVAVAAKAAAAEAEVRAKAALDDLAARTAALDIRAGEMGDKANVLDRRAADANVRDADLAIRTAALSEREESLALDREAALAAVKKLLGGGGK